MQGEQNLYSTTLGGGMNALGLSNSALTGADTSADNNPYMQLLQSGIAAGGQAAGGFFGGCPIKGSLYLMEDGYEKPVEALQIGDLIQGIDGDPQTIEEIETGVAPCVRVTTDDGHIANNSATHAFALPKGGFVVATKSLGKTILTASGAAKVISVEPIGDLLVFNVITDGSHTYRSDGVWALGVGEAERHVDMEIWRRIGTIMVSGSSPYPQTI
ncbi:MAG: hypothetical protein ABSA39_06800 [Edaphobacter sp.]